MNLWDELLVNLWAYLITAGIGAVVVLPLYLYFRPARLLPMQRLRPGGWSGLEVVLAFCIFLLFAPQLATGLLETLGFFPMIFKNAPEAGRKELWAAPLTALLALALTFWAFFGLSKTRPSHLGLTSARWPQNAILGYLAFLILTPLILGFYLLVLIVFQLLGLAHDAHPLEKLGKESLMQVEWFLIFFGAGVAAPFLEEVLFRGVLQGWLRRASWAGHVTLMAMTLAVGALTFVATLTTPEDQPPQEPNAGPLIFAVLMVVAYGAAFVHVWRPYFKDGPGYFYPDGVSLNGSEVEGGDATDPFDLREEASILEKESLPIPEYFDWKGLDLRRWHRWRQHNAWLAIGGSAMLFAVFHARIWPSPIPLLFLGLGLGYLAYRTQSLLPAIIVHALFNTVACLTLLLSHG